MSSSSNTPLSPPPTLPYPVRIEHIRAQPGLAVQRGDVLLRYRYFARDPDDKTIVESRIGTWECPVEGKIVKWKVRVGDEVTSSADALVDILEPCTHPVQLEGLCALCGKDLTGTDYLSYTPSNRANIQMSHESTGLLVSLEEASRLESLTSSQLINTRRLSLIVDLDQTIIHATVDPTVGDWMDECGLLGKEKGSDKKGKGRNPNEEALKDVGRFQLGNGDDCWYYIKPRPGLADFLSTLSEIYEMHVYTMGTRAYAERVCEVIDPEGNIFGRRILSRDENGSLTAKSLSRLFPVDTSMVVIIDDRSDVWSGSRNLIKVIPYDFFVGIGDINGTFLPKVSAPTSLLVAPPLSPSTSTASSAPSSPPLATPSPEPLLLPSSPTTVAELDEAQHHAIEDQIGERSLAKQQEELRVVAEKEKEREREEVQVDNNGDDSVKPATDGGNLRGTALLNNDDRELARLESLLRKVHQDYYSAHDRLTKKKAVGSRHRKDLPPPDVKTIIDGLKADVFTGCSFVFSGVIPLGARPDSSEIWRSSRTFGAECESGLSHRTTHLIAKQPGTQKVHDALRPPYNQQVSIVHPAWIYDSIAHWTQLATAEYDLIPASTTPPGSPDKPNTASSSAPLPPTAAASTDVPEELIGEVELGEIDIWGQADKELEAFLEESDEDESEAETDGEDASEASRSNQLANGLDKKRKRLRTSSLPPSPLSEPTPSASDRSMLPSASSSSTNGILSKRPRTDATTLVGSPLAESESVEPADTDRDRVEVDGDGDGEEGDGMGSGSGSDEEEEDLEEWAKLLSAG